MTESATLFWAPLAASGGDDERYRLSRTELHQMKQRTRRNKRQHKCHQGATCLRWRTLIGRKRCRRRRRRKFCDSASERASAKGAICAVSKMRVPLLLFRWIILLAAAATTIVIVAGSFSPPPTSPRQSGLEYGADSEQLSRSSFSNATGKL